MHGGITVRINFKNSEKGQKIVRNAVCHKNIGVFFNIKGVVKRITIAALTTITISRKTTQG